jgi:hypothetical protein
MFDKMTQTDYIERFVAPFCMKNLWWQEGDSQIYIDARKHFILSKVYHDFKSGYSIFTFKDQRYTNWYTTRKDITKSVSFATIIRNSKVSFKRKYRLKLP